MKGDAPRVPRRDVRENARDALRRSLVKDSPKKRAPDAATGLSRREEDRRHRGLGEGRTRRVRPKEPEPEERDVLALRRVRRVSGHTSEELGDDVQRDRRLRVRGESPRDVLVEDPTGRVGFVRSERDETDAA